MYVTVSGAIVVPIGRSRGTMGWCGGRGPVWMRLMIDTRVVPVGACVRRRGLFVIHVAGFGFDRAECDVMVRVTAVRAEFEVDAALFFGRG